MNLSKKFEIKLEHEAYVFCDEIAKLLKRSIEDILSDTLYKYADIVMREVNSGDFR